MSDGDSGPEFPARQGARLYMSVSLRDWFAGQAIARFRYNGLHDDPLHAERAASAAYRLADAMLAERNKRQDQGSSGDVLPPS